MHTHRPMTIHISSSSPAAAGNGIVLFIIITATLVSASCEEKMATLGGVSDSPNSQNSAEIDSLARFAVEENNKKQNALLEFGRVVKAKQQVVAGTVYYLTIEATEAGAKKLYEAKVWVKPWLNFKELQEFKLADGVPASASANTV